MRDLDPAVECYQALIGEAEADTCCRRIRVMICRMQHEPDCSSHELHFVVLSNQLMSETTTFGRYVAEIYAHIIKRDYAAALLSSETMIQHETMLYEIAAGKPLQYKTAIN